MEDNSTNPFIQLADLPPPDNTLPEIAPQTNTDLALFIERSPMPDKDGFTGIEPERVHLLVDALGSMGVPVSENAPTKEEVDGGIVTARTLIGGKKSTEFLENLPHILVDHTDLGEEPATFLKIQGDTALWIDPSVITGTGTFDKWSGRAEGHDKAYVNNQGEKKVGNSIGAIEDFAARDTQLPELEMGALSVVIPADGSEPIVFVAHSAHRVAAAKLRGEPVKTRTIKIYDRRPVQN